MRHYRSSIAKTAKERVTAFQTDGTQKYKAEYLLKREIVGLRLFDEDGQLAFERHIKKGVTHGTLYDLDDGVVTLGEPYRRGLVHGIAKQRSPDGELIGTYTMNAGTGLDLWHVMANWGQGWVYLSEARYVKEGKWHGFEWWPEEDQRSVQSEHHFWENLQRRPQVSFVFGGTFQRRVAACYPN